MKCFEICIEMFTQRGYTNIQEDEEKILCTTCDAEIKCGVNKQIFNKFNISHLKENLIFMQKHDILHLLIIYENDITPLARESIELFKEKNKFHPALGTNILLKPYTFELFSKNELQFNITKHALQPKFEKVNLTTKFQFPILKISDPIAKFYNYKVDDVVKICDEDNLIYFRIVK